MSVFRNVWLALFAFPAFSAWANIASTPAL